MALPTAVKLGAGLFGLGASSDSEASFIGPLARTWSNSAMKLAGELFNKGATPDQIWSETGKLGSPTFLDVDGKWKQEITDENFVYKEPTSLLDSVGGPISDEGITERINLLNETSDELIQTLADVSGFDGSVSDYRKMLKEDIYFSQNDITTGEFKSKAVNINPEMSAAYPQIDDTSVYYNDVINNDPDIQGSFNTVTGETDLLVGQPNLNTKSSLAHERQHWIQGQEGFATGGSPEFFQNQQDSYNRSIDLILNQKKKAISIASKSPEFIAVEKEWLDYVNQFATGTRSGGGINYRPRTKTEQRKIKMLSKKAKDLLKKAGKPYEVEVARIQNDLIADPDYQYKNLMGEVEARNVEKRLDMTMDERITTPPWMTREGDVNNFSYEPSRLGRKSVTGAVGGSGGLLASIDQASAGMMPQSNRLNSIYSPSNLARLRNDDVGNYQAAQSPQLASAAGLMGQINEQGVDDPLMGFVSPRMPSELMNKMAYNDKRGVSDYLKAAAGLLGFY